MFKNKINLMAMLAVLFSATLVLGACGKKDKPNPPPPVVNTDIVYSMTSELYGGGTLSLTNKGDLVYDINYESFDGVTSERAGKRVTMQNVSGNVYIATNPTNEYREVKFLNTVIHSQNSNVEVFGDFDRDTTFTLEQDYILVKLSNYMPPFVLNKEGVTLNPAQVLYTMSFLREEGASVDAVVDQDATEQELKEAIGFYQVLGSGAFYVVGAEGVAKDHTNIVSITGVDTSVIGTYNAVVTMDDGLVINQVVYVGRYEMPEESNNIQLSFSSIYVAVGTLFEEMTTQISIYDYDEGQSYDITSDMITGFDTTQVGSFDITITFNEEEYSMTLNVYDPENLVALEVSNISFVEENISYIIDRFDSEVLFVEQGLEIEEIIENIRVRFNDGNYENFEIGDNLLNIQGYNPNTLGIQFVTVTYGQLTKTLIVYVYNETNNIVVEFGFYDEDYSGFDQMLPIFVVEGQDISFEGITIGVMHADGTIETNPLTEEDFDNIDLENINVITQETAMLLMFTGVSASVNDYIYKITKTFTYGGVSYNYVAIVLFIDMQLPI